MMRFRVTRCAGLVLLIGLGSCGAPMVTQSTVNHAYEGHLRRLVVYNNLFDGYKRSLTTSFDSQFTAEMDRCGVWVRIIDYAGVDLNPKTRLIKAAQEIQADTLLTATWTKRETGRTSEQYSLFTLSQIAHQNETSLGEVWKTEIL